MLDLTDSPISLHLIRQPPTLPRSIWAVVLTPTFSSIPQSLVTRRFLASFAERVISDNLRRSLRQFLSFLSVRRLLGLWALPDSQRGSTSGSIATNSGESVGHSWTTNKDNQFSWRRRRPIREGAWQIIPKKQEQRRLPFAALLAGTLPQVLRLTFFEYKDYGDLNCTMSAKTATERASGCLPVD